jgi:hypothetical protein
MLERPSSTGPRPGACSVQPKKDGRSVPFERCLADAYACLLSSSRTSIKTRKPELVMLVSHEIATRGWNEVREDEVCKIQGVGPISPAAAREIASDAFLSGLFYDGRDLRHFAAGPATPVEVLLALQLGEPPEFDGFKCIDCGRRFRNEKEHTEPHVAGGCQDNRVQCRADPAEQRG